MFRLACIILAILGSGMVVGATPASRDWALVIGIDDYLYLDDQTGGDLRGAESDARRFHQALTAVVGVPTENINLLLGRQATRAAIEDALTRWLPARVAQGDRVFFYFSGHGSQVVDDLWVDEVDGLDETICPVDIRPESTEIDIRDDELRGWLAAIGAQETVVILDSCHSGTATRLGVGYARERTLGGRAATRSLGTRAEGAGGDAFAELLEIPGLVEIAAASSAESALEIELPGELGGPGRFGGVFTAHLLRGLHNLPPGGSFEDLYWFAYHGVKADGFVQTPQLTGDASTVRVAGATRVDGIRGDWARARLQTAEAADGARWITGTPGLAPAQGLLLVDDAGGTFVVTDLREGRGLLRHVSGTAEAPAPGGLRPIGVRVPVPELTVSVGTVRGPLVQSLGRVRGVRVEAGGAASSLGLTQTAQGDSVIVVGLDQARRLAVAERDDGRLRDFVVRQRNALTARAFVNPMRPFSVSVSRPTGSPSFRVGESVRFQIESSAAGYLTLVDQAPDGTLTVLYPGRDVGYPRIEAGTPRFFPDPGFVILAEEPSGFGALLAVVTEDPLPFEFESSGEAVLREPAELLRLMARVLAPGAGAPASTNGEVYVAMESWNAAALDYEIVGAADTPAESSGGSGGNYE